MAAKIAIIVFIVIALGAAVWMFHYVGSGGVKFPAWFSMSSSSFTLGPTLHGPTLPSIQNSSPTAGQTYLGPSSGGGNGASAGAPSLIQDPSTFDPSEIPSGFTASELSPYFKEVTLSGVSYGGFGYYGTIVLNAYFANRATGTIDITGWQIKARDGGEYIPQAIDLYDPSGLSAPSDIRVGSGDTVYLYSSSAPFNLRLNECVGYIAHVANFVPALPEECPYPDRSVAQSFTGACEQYIDTLGSCASPDLSNPLVPRNDYACQDYLENNFNYSSCFKAHVGDPNFLSNQVWVWMGSNVVNEYHDSVELLDRNGKLVDVYTY